MIYLITFLGLLIVGAIAFAVHILKWLARERAQLMTIKKTD